MKTDEPVCSRWWMDGFLWVARSMVRRNFFVFAIDESLLKSSLPKTQRPVMVYANHPGWWDPIVGMLLSREYFPERSYFAPIDADALAKYRSFRRLGYFGVKLNSKQGAAEFLVRSLDILRKPDTTLWITPEGKFTDPRDPNPEFMPGVAHLASRCSGMICYPLAIDYAFVEEKLPLLLCRWGNPVEPSDLEAEASETNHVHHRKQVLSSRLEQHLREAQSGLAQSIIRRDWSAFRVLLRSKGARHGQSFRS